jgi:hypothetical protein
MMEGRRELRLSLQVYQFYSFVMLNLFQHL